MKFKKGSAPQSSTQWAAALVGLIALYLLIYFFLLPKETQQELLGEKETAEGDKANREQREPHHERPIAQDRQGHCG